MNIGYLFTENDSIAQEGIIKDNIIKIKNKLKARFSKKKNYSGPRDFSYRKNDITEIKKTIKPILTEYCKIKGITRSDKESSYEDEFINGESECFVIIYWDLWYYNPNARTEDDKNEEFGVILTEMCKKIDKVLPSGYKSDYTGDWDGGSIDIVDKDINRSIPNNTQASESVQRYFNQIDEVAQEGIITGIKNWWKSKLEENEKRVQDIRQKYLDEEQAKKDKANAAKEKQYAYRKEINSALLNKMKPILAKAKYLEFDGDMKDFYNGKYACFILASYYHGDMDYDENFEEIDMKCDFIRSKEDEIVEKIKKILPTGYDCTFGYNGDGVLVYIDDIQTNRAATESVQSFVNQLEE